MKGGMIMESNQNETTRWCSEMAKLQEELSEHKRARNYHEGQRKKTQANIDRLKALDPRQMKLEIWL